MRVEELGKQYQTENTTGKGKNQLGKDDFFKILIAQLQYQDPLKPLDDKDFIAQMAQFSTLEQMQNMQAELSSMKALSMLGKLVYAEKNIEGTSKIVPMIGRVESASFIEGKLYLHVAGNVISGEDIKQVYSEEDAAKLENHQEEANGDNE